MSQRPSASDTVVTRAAVGFVCPYCEGTNFTRLHSDVEDRLGVVPGKWGFLRCDRCGSARLDPFPGQTELAAYYPQVYGFTPHLAKSPLKRLLAASEYKLYYESQNRAQVRMVLKVIGYDGRKAKLLDIGCGNGLRLIEFARRGLEPFGADFDPAAVEHVKTRLGIPAVQIDVTTPLKHTFGPETFDVLTAFYVMEHVIDVVGTLKAAATLVKPGGWIVTAVPLVDSFQSRFFGRRWSQVTEAPRHVTLPTRAGMERACRRAGLEDVRLIADSVWANAAVFGLSAVQKSTTSHLYGQGGAKFLLLRVLGAAASVVGMPFCFVENLFFRPGMGIAISRKPAA